MKFKKTIMTLAITSAMQPVFAIEDNNQDEIIVTATRTAQTVDESLASVTVITRSDIESSQANDISELLEGIPGLQIKNNGGGYGKSSAIYMRGTNDTHLLVMIDGVKIGSVSKGTIAFQYISLSDIEKIEIVRGPRSTLYGSEAIGGVIQIFTRKGQASQHTEATVSGGSHNTQKINVINSGSLGSTKYSLSASQFSTDGFDIKNIGETDDDGYSNTSYAISLERPLSNSHSLILNMTDAQGESEYDGATNRSEFHIQSMSAKLQSEINERWSSQLQYSIGKDFSDNYKDTTFKSTYNSTRTNITWQNDITVSDAQLLTVGIDQLKDELESTVVYDNTDKENLGIFVQSHWKNAKSNMVFGLRQDNDSNFGGHTTGNLSYGYKFSDTLKATSSAGTAFRAPTFNQLYYPAAGDPNLLPEEAISYELGLQGKGSLFDKWSVTAYQTDITNLISGWPPVNIGQASITGAELAITKDIFGWQTIVSASLTDPRDSSTGNLLPRRSKEVYTLSGNKKYGNLNTTIEIKSYSSSYDKADNLTLLPGYQLLNMRFDYSIMEKLKISARFNNILNADYQTIDGYNNDGRNYYLGLNYKM